MFRHVNLICLAISWLLIPSTGLCFSSQAGLIPGTRDFPESPVPPPQMPSVDAAWLNDLPGLRYSRIEREFDAQRLTIEIFRFDSSESAFSAYTFLHRSGAKAYSGLADCIVQSGEIILWQGNQVSRTTFPDLLRAHLASYVGWLRTQLPKSRPVPELYLKLPAAFRVDSTRRYLVRDKQASALWGGVPGIDFFLDHGNRMIVARYRSPQQEYWCGWVLNTDPQDVALMQALDGRAMGRQGKSCLHLNREGDLFAFYLGPDEPEIWHGVLRQLSQAASGKATAGEVDLTKFFRRDAYSYGDVILGGFRMVFLFLTAAFLTGLLIGVVIQFITRFIGRKTGLAEETVVHLHLEVEMTKHKKNRTQPPEFK